MSATQYTPDHFIEKFEKADDATWTEGFYTNAAGKHCALGHCGSITTNIGDEHTKEGQALRDLFTQSFDGRRRCRVADINDFKSEAFPQPTPKQRILAALRFIKEKMETKKE